MSGADQSQMFRMLLDEIDDTLSDFESRCLRLDASNPQTELNDMFRFVHNIKGASRIYGLSEFGTFVHSVEDLLGRLRMQPFQMDSSVTDLLLQVHKFLSAWVEELRKDPKHVPNGEVILSEIQALIHGIGESPADNSSNIEEPNKIAADLPNIADLLRMKKQKDEPSLALNATEKHPVAETKEFLNQEISVFGKREKTTANTTPKSEIYAFDDDIKRRIQQTKKKRPTGNLKIGSNKIDEIMQLIGELSIQQSILWHHHQMGSLDNVVCKNAISLNQKTIKDLQEMILGLRMQPIDGLFQRVERSTRDLARELDKKVTLIMDGANILMDKTVIEKMADPLIHLLRNAIDHGVESEADRIAKNKSVPAIVKVTATQDSGQVIIDIEDDGQGIDPAKILIKAKEKGMIKEGQLVTESELIKLIFEPGFSTKEAVTEISGRGVGMDVVQQSIQEIGGTIEIKTVVGRGTAFHITLPTSLEIVDALIFKVGESTYIVPTQDVQEILELKDLTVSRLASGCPAIRVHDQMVPVENLSDYLDEKEAKQSDDSQNFVALLIKLKDRSNVAFRIDEIISQQQIVVRPLSDHLSRLPGFTAVGVLGNGEPALILSMSFIGECYFNWTHKGRDSRRAL